MLVPGVAGLSVGVVDRSRHGVVRDVVEERVVRAGDGRAAGQAVQVETARHAFDQTVVGDDLSVAVRTEDEVAVRVGCEQRHIEDVGVGRA